MSELTSVDLKILEFINSNGAIGIKDLKTKFSKIDSLEYRLKIMSTQKYSELGRAPLPDSSFILQKYDVVGTGIYETSKPLDIYEITDYGRKYLQDHKNQTDIYRKELWIKNAWIPIIVSLATNLVIGGIKQLLPLIQQWLSNIF